VKPPLSRKATGIEETNFKTESSLPNMEIDRSLLLTPLPDIDGIISIRIVEKVTFGDDKVLETQSLEVKSFCGQHTNTVMKVSMEIGEVELIGRYFSA
jgi:hypothetical protein